MASGVLASLLAALALGFAEGLGRFYPARDAWWRIRRARGRDAVRIMRSRFEASAAHRMPRLLALVLCGIALGWIASASLLDKRWHEIVLDVLPSVFVAIALMRIPVILRSIADRMKGYERQAGDEPDRGPEDGEDGPTAVAL